MTTDESTPFRWALAGYGAGGRTFHRPLITSATGLELVAVVTGTPDGVVAHTGGGTGGTIDLAPVDSGGTAARLVVPLAT